MYWGDAKTNRIEKASLSGTGRTILLKETKAFYYAFVLHAGNIFFTDWNSA